jgi:hypothetical protein
VLSAHAFKQQMKLKCHDIIYASSGPNIDHINCVILLSVFSITKAFKQWKHGKWRGSDLSISKFIDPKKLFTNKNMHTTRDREG